MKDSELGWAPLHLFYPQVAIQAVLYLECVCVCVCQALSPRVFLTFKCLTVNSRNNRVVERTYEAPSTEAPPHAILGYSGAPDDVPASLG